MIWSYDTYTSDANEGQQFPVACRELKLDNGILYGLEYTISISGRIIRTTQEDLYTRISELQAIRSKVGKNFTLKTNAAVDTAFSLASSQTIGGLSVIDLQYPQRLPGEMGLFVDYTITIGGVVDINAGANPVVLFEQKFDIQNPFGAGEHVKVPVQGGFPQHQDTYTNLSSTYTQSGRLVFLRKPPSNWYESIPAPISSGDVHNQETRVSPGIPLYKRNGIYFLWPIDYSFLIETTTPIPLQLLLPSVGG